MPAGFGMRAMCTGPATAPHLIWPSVERARYAAKCEAVLSPEWQTERQNLGYVAG